MLFSVEGERYALIDPKKVREGSYQTSSSDWLVEPVREFLERSSFSGVLDPFAGDGMLLDHISKNWPGVRTRGLDINSLAYERNDSLVHVPTSANVIIVTNPPYLAKHSARRKRVISDVEKYFSETSYSDIYQVALEKCLASASNVVAIVPETFLFSGFHRSRLDRVSILVGSKLFDDTSTPVCVACFAGSATRYTQLYVNDTRVGTLDEADSLRSRKSTQPTVVRFNDPDGCLALKAVDGVSPNDRIRFMPASTSDYSRDRIVHSSRLMTRIGLPTISSGIDLDALCSSLNSEVERLRTQCGDLVLSPFKGDNKAGLRRRRLDFAQARFIICTVLHQNVDAELIN